MTNIIDLELYRTKGSKVFTGRDRGIEVRERSRIDEIEKETNDIITIIIPSDIRSINPSFLEEFLFNVVSKLKKEGFLKKFLFENESTRYNFDEDLDEAIDCILKRDNSLTRD